MPEPRILMSGIALGESPRWHDGQLWATTLLRGYT